jgi:YfiH family protein
LDADNASELAQLREREGDALVGASNAYALCIRTADCVPILIGCRTTGIAAAVHAGWRGIVARVVPAAVEALINKGAERESLVAAIGPHIGPVHFEVSYEVAQELDQCAPEADAICRRDGARPTVRLAQLVVAQLLGCGVAKEGIDVVALCTFSKSDEFFSYRRDGSRSGRELSVIMPKVPGT